MKQMKHYRFCLLRILSSTSPSYFFWSQLFCHFPLSFGQLPFIIREHPFWQLFILVTESLMDEHSRKLKRVKLENIPMSHGRTSREPSDTLHSNYTVVQSLSATSPEYSPPSRNTVSSASASSAGDHRIVTPGLRRG